MVFSDLPFLDKSGLRVIGYAAQTLSLGQITVGVATSIWCNTVVFGVGELEEEVVRRESQKASLARACGKTYINIFF